jgi:hypothetical protein
MEYTTNLKLSMTSISNHKSNMEHTTNLKLHMERTTNPKQRMGQDRYAVSRDVILRV